MNTLRDGKFKSRQSSTDAFTFPRNTTIIGHPVAIFGALFGNALGRSLKGTSKERDPRFKSSIKEKVTRVFTYISIVIVSFLMLFFVSGIGYAANQDNTNWTLLGLAAACLPGIAVIHSYRLARKDKVAECVFHIFQGHSLSPLNSSPVSSSSASVSYNGTPSLRIGWRSAPRLRALSTDSTNTSNP